MGLYVFLCFLMPVAAGTAEYMICRLVRRRVWRWVPAAVVAGLFLLVTAPGSQGRNSCGMVQMVGYLVFGLPALLSLAAIGLGRLLSLGGEKD